jgi:hypothetical protein
VVPGGTAGAAELSLGNAKPPEDPFMGMVKLLYANSPGTPDPGDRF